ncbi:Cof-type HAD-IIB family hydrolase [Sporolactobacillus spathodeae]|uniref:Cof-type HAD-IIB family hydrolase n=1 Tax=Sporolactobacillus spathodeae TaxID=1465502 RepID=UPI0039EA01EB
MANLAIQLIFSDIDGTLLQSDHQISRRTAGSVHACSQRGIPFILVSARMPGGILPLQKVLNISDPVVCYGGALILSGEEANGSRRILFQRPLRRDAVESLRHLLQSIFPDICLTLYSFNRWIVSDPSDSWVIQEQQIAGTPFETYSSILENKLPPIHKILCMGEPEQITRLQELLAEKQLLANSYKSKPTYLEITDISVNKSSAVAFICHYLGVAREQTIAFGDNYNDIDMLQAVGTGIAMANAPIQVQKAADQTTMSNDQDGISHALETLGICPSSL